MKLSSFLISDQHFGCFGLIFRGRHSILMYFVDLDKKVAETQVKHCFWHFQCSFFVLCALFCENLTCAWASPLVTVCVSDRSRCGAVRTVISLAQPSRHFVRAGSLSLWRGANCDIARPTLLALCACWIALVVVRADLVDSLEIGKEILWIFWKVLLWRSCKMVQS